MTEVFIGMPVFNCEPFLEEALDSLVDQDFRGWRLLISDNNSEDSTGDIARRFAAADPRIRYHRHPRNLGAPANFKFVLDSADAEFFMWAAGDDTWAPSFISAGVRAMKKDPTIGFAFTNLVNTDTFGREIRNYPGFTHFSGPSAWRNVLRFILAPEIMGKANMMYSVMRRNPASKAFHASPLTEHWGSDMIFVLALLARTRFFYRHEVLFRKRVVRNEDSRDSVQPIIVDRPRELIFPWKHAPEYLTDQIKAVMHTRHVVPATLAVGARPCLAVGERNLQRVVRRVLRTYSSMRENR
ncbi:MAG: glycosyltransferase [Thermoanaerobaculales bacterium]|nr:glycosyltransferase [Thermoanaerobaculales bacterium]